MVNRKTGETGDGRNVIRYECVRELQDRLSSGWRVDGYRYPVADDQVKPKTRRKKTDQGRPSNMSES